MNKLLALILCILLIIIIPVLAQENPAGLQGDDVEVFASDGAFIGLQGDDVEVFASDGAFIGLQGDDVEVFADGGDVDANPLSVMQGDDSEIFVIQPLSDALQGDDIEVFILPSNQLNNVSVSDNDIVESAELALANTLPDANLAILGTIPDEVGVELPDTNVNAWQEATIDTAFLIIGGGIAIAIILLASIFIISGSLRVDW